MYSPNDVFVLVDGVERERIHCSDSHEMNDARGKLQGRYPSGVVFVQFEHGQPEIWEDFI
jgi:hypothetical protein